MTSHFNESPLPLINLAARAVRVVPGSLRDRSSQGGSKTTHPTSHQKWPMNPWFDLRENLQETMEFPMKYGIFLSFFP